MTKFTVLEASRKKARGEKFTMLSVYDYPTARLASKAGIDTLLVGDSLSMTVLGHADTVSVTTDEMLHHVKAVARGAGDAMVIADMPFMSYQISTHDAVRNAGRFLKEGRADAVKIEGGAEMAPTLAAIYRAGVPVIGHIGLTPQSAGQLGGMTVQGKTVAAARSLLADAYAFQDAGAFAVLMECVPADVAREITNRLTVPTVSYGAGLGCDAQGLVLADILGLFDGHVPKFSKKFADIGVEIESTIRRYADDVKVGAFPGPEHQYETPKALLDAWDDIFTAHGGRD
jgi:3-methyl-2-oxobutanoate hydroxymethyltransferase